MGSFLLIFCHAFQLFAQTLVFQSFTILKMSISKRIYSKDRSQQNVLFDVLHIETRKQKYRYFWLCEIHQFTIYSKLTVLFVYVCVCEVVVVVMKFTLQFLVIPYRYQWCIPNLVKIGTLVFDNRQHRWSYIRYSVIKIDFLDTPVCFWLLRVTAPICRTTRMISIEMGHNALQPIT